MSTEPRDRVRVAVASPDLYGDVLDAVRALREADPAFGEALDPIAAHWVPQPCETFLTDQPPIGDTEQVALARACRERWPDHRFRMLVMWRGFADGWFSHHHRPYDTVLLSLYGWELITSLPRAAFLAYELLLWNGRLLSASYDPERLIHADHHGCFFDASIDKRGITLKLKSADACLRCRELLEVMDMPIARFRRLLEAIRALAVPAWYEP